MRLDLPSSAITILASFGACPDAPDSGPRACDNPLRNVRVCTEKAQRWPRVIKMSREDEKMKRILIVEDEERLARLISRVLREEGYATETAGDGKAGLLLALSEDFDLLILDWMLPDRSGVQ